MRKEYVILLVLLPLSFMGCNVREKNTMSIRKGIGFIIDTTLQQEYMDVKPFQEYNSTNTKKMIVSAKEAFEKVKASINNLVEEGIINNKDSFYIHLTNDSIWIIKNKPVSKMGELQFGGTVYFEIRKIDGYILKSIIEE